LGFCVFAYLSSKPAIKLAAAITIILGFVTSLTIETLQAFLPTRSSGITDIITNTRGTAIGVMLYRWSFTQSLLTEASQEDELVYGNKPRVWDDFLGFDSSL
jgi:glycopeptide antibiotics resistance protein